MLVDWFIEWGVVGGNVVRWFLIEKEVNIIDSSWCLLS